MGQTSGDFGENNALHWELNNGTLTISGTGEMPEYAYQTTRGGFGEEYQESITAVIIDVGVTNIGYYAFSGCVNLNSVTISSSVTRIEAWAFNNCSSLISINIPSSVTTLFGGAFLGCTSLTEITIDANNPNYSSVDGVLFDKSKTELMRYPEGKINPAYSIPSSVQIVEGYAFEGCSGLISVDIPASVYYFGTYLFGGCSSLTEITVAAGNPRYKSENGVLFDISFPTLVRYPAAKANSAYTIPSTVTEIGLSAFSGCNNLTEVIIPSSVTSIDQFAFSDCSNLISVNIPEGITSIAWSAFSGCKSLTSVTIPSSVTSISWSAFSGCESLTSMNIPSSVTSIEYPAFYDCIKLTAITVDAGNNYYESEDGILFEHGQSILVKYPAAKTNTTYTIPSSVSRIEGSAFQDCSTLTSVIIPFSVTIIKSGAFENCSGLTSIYANKATPPRFEYGDVFSGVNKNTCTLYVPVGSLAAYRAAAEWQDFVNIVEFDNVEADTPCDLSSIPAGAFYDATVDLCSRTVLSGSDVDGAVNVMQNLKRAHLAKIAFRGLYLVNGGAIPAPGTLPSDYYPSIYSDLNVETAQNKYYYRPAKALLYLEYGDGISAFDRNRSTFNPEDYVARADVLKVLLEAFNIKPELNTSGSYSNADITALKTNNPLKFGYIYKAKSLGIIDDIETFRPFDDCLRGEAFLMLYRIMTKIEASAISDPAPTAASYFEPLNVTTTNLAMGLGLASGNFNHYTKTSFAISGITPLVFAHTYNSYTTELPDEFFGMYNNNAGKTITYKPLGAGWSHPYHSFVTVVGNRMSVHWGGGSIHVYGSNGTDFVCESVGVYDEASIAGGIVTIKTKGQVEYRFKKNSLISSGVLELYSIKDRNGNELTIQYGNGVDDVARIVSVSDGSRSLNFTYKNGANLIEQVSDPLGRSIRFEYTLNAALNEYLLTSFTDAKNQTTRYEYGTQPGQGRLLTKVQLPKGNYIENQYDLNRRLKQSTAGTGGTPKSKTAVTVASDYQANSKTVSSTVQSFHNGSLSYDYDYTFNGNNKVTKVKDSQNQVEVTAFYNNAAHATRPTSVKSNSSEIDQIQYDGKGNVTQIRQRSNTGGETQTMTMTYNSFNDVTSVTDPRNNTTYYDYDGKGNLTGVRAPENSTTAFTVNGKGLVTDITNPEGLQTGLGYDSYGNPTSTTVTALSLTSTTAYDNAGRVTSVKDFLNRENRFTYDANDNLLSEVNALNRTTSYGYDANDNLTTITNAKGGVTSMSYDNTTDWLTSVAFGGSTKQYAYNDDGSLSTFTKPDGTTLSRTYDNLGRITNDGINSYAYDSQLRPASVTKDGKTLTFGYDGFNRVNAVGYDGATVACEYDANGNILRLIYPDGKAVNYTYDNLNRMKTVTDWNNRTITYSYLKDSRLQSVAYPNGMTVSYAYDNAGRQTGKTVQRSDNSVIASYAFTLDKAGNITQENRTEPYANVTIPSETVNYAYNSANRITQAGDISFAFDANGNTTSRGSASYSFDRSDKLTSGEGFTFEYDGLGHIRSNGSKRYWIDITGMGNVIAETDMSNIPTAYYVYGLGLEARILSNGTTEYYVSDYRGSVVAMVDMSATITHKYQYDEFGKVIQKEESDDNPFRYVGKHGVMYANDNLYYMRARFYDPTIGRFLSEDPIWSTNLYPYADNNPIMGIDPRGTTTVAQINNIKDINEINRLYESSEIQDNYYLMMTLMERKNYLERRDGQEEEKKGNWFTRWIKGIFGSNNSNAPAPTSPANTGNTHGSFGDFDSTTGINVPQGEMPKLFKIFQ
jgi:RHS repeat-associated protein